MVSSRRAGNGRLGSRPIAVAAGPHPAPGPPRPPGATWPAGVVRLRLDGAAEALLAVPPAEPPQPGEPQPRPLLVFFHGAGGSAGDALSAVREPAASRGALVLATTSAARTWDLIAGGLGRDVAVLDAALGEVFGALPVGRVAFGGFSDGGSYALSLGLANGDLADAVLAFSPGFLAPPGRSGRPRVWISHGADDRVLPVDRCGRRVSAELGAAGYDVAYDEFAGGHVVRPERVTAALDWWLTPPGAR
jgi:phospholipase/carboxylesterase